MPQLTRRDAISDAAGTLRALARVARRAWRDRVTLSEALDRELRDAQTQRAAAEQLERDLRARAREVAS